MLCSNIHQRGIKGKRMRQCKCGGKVNQYPLTNNKVAWNCDSCGRYEQFEDKNDLHPIPAKTKKTKKPLSKIVVEDKLRI